MKSKLGWVAVGTIVLFTTAAFATRPMRPPERSRIVGVWSGYSGHLDFLRLELDENGTGYLSIGYNASRTNATLYRVQKWQYSDWKVELTAKPIDAAAEPVFFTNFVARYQSAECEFGGKDWRRNVKLFNENEWKARARPLQERIARYRIETR